MMIKSENIRELQTKINCPKKINEIIKEVNIIENDLSTQEKELVNKFLNKENIVWFYETLIFSGGLGEFYTPKCISDLINLIVGDIGETAVYEPTIGSGNLVSKFSNVWGQEFNEDTFNLISILHPEWNIGLGDTLSEDCFEGKKFDVVITNPPYGGSGWQPFEHEKFKPCTVPKKAIEMAFVQHCVDKMSDKGKMVAVLPHGILFRGNKEKKVREYLIPIIDTVIGLPSNLFSNTSIPVCIVVFDNNKEKDGIHFIDASKEFDKEKKTNVMNGEHIVKIVKSYREKKFVDKFANYVELEEIEENDFNLNIPRYVDTFEDEVPIDIIQVSKDYAKLVEEENKIREDLLKQLEELNGDEEALNAIKSMLEVR